MGLKTSSKKQRASELNSEGELVRNEAAARPEPSAEPGFGWRKLQALGAVTVPLVFTYIMVSEGFFEPFFLIMGGPFLVGLGLLAMRNRVGVIWLGVVSVAFIAMNIPFIIPVLGMPAASTDFIQVLTATTGALIVAVSTIPAFRQGKGHDQARPAARNVGIAAVALVVILVSFSLVAGARYESLAAQPGDVTVVAENFEFADGTITADAGEISIHVSNNDSPLHTFTIDELDVNLAVPGGKASRVTFNAPAGTYDFYCTPHPDMTGTLVVR